MVRDWHVIMINIMIRLQKCAETEEPIDLIYELIEKLASSDQMDNFLT